MVKTKKSNDKFPAKWASTNFDDFDFNPPGQPVVAESHKPLPTPRNPLGGQNASDVLGENSPQAIAGRLATMLDGGEPNEDAIYQAIIKYRGIARQLPPETRATMDKLVSSYSNSRVIPRSKDKRKRK